MVLYSTIMIRKNPFGTKVLDMLLFIHILHNLQHFVVVIKLLFIKLLK